jgi:hypothetical protein
MFYLEGYLYADAFGILTGIREVPRLRGNYARSLPLYVPQKNGDICMRKT